MTTSFRTGIFPAYKANREPAPPELKRQFAWCRELCRLLGMAEFGSPTHEADDIIGTIAARLRARGHSAVLVTRDKDLAQLVREGDHYWDYAGERRYAYHEIEEQFGVRPERIADYLALTGDSVDNIPGVPGVGPKTASVLLRKFASLEELYDGLDQVPALPIRGASKLPSRLREHREAAFFARRLTTIACDMPLDVTADSLQRRKPDLDALGAFYDRAKFGAALRRQAERLSR
jgi:5'-3' exonuclease